MSRQRACCREFTRSLAATFAADTSQHLEIEVGTEGPAALAASTRSIWQQRKPPTMRRKCEALEISAISCCNGTVKKCDYDALLRASEHIESPCSRSADILCLSATARHIAIGMRRSRSLIPMNPTAHSDWWQLASSILTMQGGGTANIQIRTVSARSVAAQVIRDQR
jgi:hypothetical protein